MSTPLNHQPNNEQHEEKHMPIIARRPEDNFVPAPAGTHAAVCVDVEDLGMQPNPFRSEPKLIHKIRVSWQLAKRTPDGRPYLVSKLYTLTLHERSTLREHIEGWIGRRLTPSELTGFDVESLIARPCMLSIAHDQKLDGRIFAVVDSVYRSRKTCRLPRRTATYGKSLGSYLLPGVQRAARPRLMKVGTTAIPRMPPVGKTPPTTKRQPNGTTNGTDQHGGTHA
jgi:hypothetical protein